MEQHPIPQQISSYEFKLVGEMTLKQFLKAASGVILAIIINSTSLVFFLKWPLMIVTGGGGLLLAFVPLQDRPLETWILSFIKSIYSPTIYIYKKRINKNWLEVDRTTKLVEEVNEKEEVLPKKDLGRVKEFIESLPSTQKIEAQEMAEEKILIPTKEIKILPEPDKIPDIANQVKAEDWRDQKATLNLKSEKLGATGRVLFGSIPMPDIPDLPNVVVGMTTDFEGKIIEDVIVEIQDEHGNPSRVLKTNSLGQFKTSSPLANGRYLIIAEKEGHEFDRVNVDVTGQIVKPMRIISKTVASKQ